MQADAAQTTHKTSELSGYLLDLAIAPHDPYLAGSRIKHRGDHSYCVADFNDEECIVALICDASNLDRMSDLLVKYKLTSRDVYSPSTKWAQGGDLIESKRIYLGPIEQSWVASMRGTIGVRSETPLLAAMRTLAMSIYGDTFVVGAV